MAASFEYDCIYLCSRFDFDERKIDPLTQSPGASVRYEEFSSRLNPAFSRQRTRTHPDYEEKESLKPEFDYDTSFQELLALKGPRIRTKGRLVRLEEEWVAQRSRISEKVVEDRMP